MTGRITYNCRDCERTGMSPGDAMLHESVTGHETCESQKTRTPADSDRNHDHLNGEGRTW